MPTSADVAFRLIAAQKRLLTPSQLQQAQDRAAQEGISLETAVVELGLLDDASLERIVSTRSKHGRDCSACGEPTYLLPRQTVHDARCERCGGALSATSADAPPRGGQPAAAPPSGRPGGPPSGRPGGPPSARPGGPPSGRPGGPPSARPGGPPSARPGGPPSGRPGGPPSARPGGPPGARPGGVKPGPGGPPSGRPIGAGGPPSGRPIGAGGPPSGRPIGARAGAASPPPEPDAGSSSGILDDVTFSAPVESLHAERARAPRPGPEPAPAEEDDLQFRSVAFDADEVPAPVAPARATPQPPASNDEEDAPTMPPRPAGAAIGSAIGAAVDPTAPKARALRQAGGGFGYEPPEELTPRAVRPSAFAPPPGAGSPPPAGEADAASSPDSGEAPSDAAPRPQRLGTAGLAAADARFAPPAEHLAELEPLEEVLVPPLRQDLVRILRLPLHREGIGMIVVGALLVGLTGRFGCFSLPLIALTAYPLTYLIHVTRAAMVGKEDLPGWPDYDMMELLGNLFRSLAVYLACLLPLIVILVPAMKLTASVVAGSAKSAPVILSIGEGAHEGERAREDWHVKHGTDVSAASFVEAGTVNDVPIGTGQWTVIGFLNRSNADDTGTTEMFTDMGAPSALGAAGLPVFQVYDLDRVGLAMRGQVRVLAAYADPDERIVRGRFAWLRGSDDSGEAEVDPDDPQAAREAQARALVEKASRVSQLGRGPSGEQVAPFQGLKVVRTYDWTFPGPFEGIRPLPSVYVIDPSGRVAREYGSGVEDEKLYADLKDLMRGGSGDVSPERLPYDIKPVGGLGALGAGALLGLGLLALPLLLLATFYWPAAQLAMIAFDSAGLPFSYPVVIRAVRVALPDYLALFGVMAGLYVASGVLGSVVNVVTIFLPDGIRGGISSFLAGCFSFYAQVVGAYAIGRYYYANRAAIGWFVR